MSKTVDLPSRTLYLMKAPKYKDFSMIASKQFFFFAAASPIKMFSSLSENVVASNVACTRSRIRPVTIKSSSVMIEHSLPFQ
jgi:hypothetical protein